MSIEPRTNNREQTACHGGLVRADLKAFLDRELPPVRRWLVRRHIARCHACREETVWLQRLGKSMRRLESASPSPELRARILATLPPMDPVAAIATSVRPPRASRLRYAFGGALCFAAISGAFALYHGVSGNRPPVRPPHMTDNHSVNMTPSPQRAAADRSDNPLAIGPPDPLSKQADELTRRQIADERKAAERRMPETWSNAVKAVREAAPEARHNSYVSVQVEAKDTAAAAQSLQAWARKVGAHVQDAAAPSKATPLTVALSIPPAMNGELFKRLKGAGKILVVAPQGTTANGGYGIRPGVPTGQAQGSRRAQGDTAASPIEPLAAQGAAPNQTGGRQLLNVVVQLIPTGLLPD